MVKLSGFPLMLQAAVLDGVAFDPFWFHQDGLPAPKQSASKAACGAAASKSLGVIELAGGQAEGRKVVRMIEARQQTTRLECRLRGQ